MNRNLELIFKINWHLKKNGYKTEELKYIIEYLQELVMASEWDDEPLSNILQNVTNSDETIREFEIFLKTS